MLRNIQNYRFPDKQSYIIECLAVIKHNVEKSFQQKKAKERQLHEAQGTYLEETIKQPKKEQRK